MSRTLRIARRCIGGCTFMVVAACSGDPGSVIPESTIKTESDGDPNLIEKSAGAFDLSQSSNTPFTDPWPFGFMLYEFDTQERFGDTAVDVVGEEMRRARDDIGRDTTLLLFELPNVATDHVIVKWTGTGTCGVVAGGESDVGMVGGNQDLCLGTGVGLRTAIHESGHALGMYHEQQRPDRNDFLTVTVSDPVNYDIKSNSRAIGDFDGNSVMLYRTAQAPSGTTYEWVDDATALQWNGPPAAGQPVDRDVRSGGDHLSLGDIRGLQVIYGDQFDPSAAFTKVASVTGKTPGEYGIFYRNQNGGVTHLYRSGSSWQTRDLGGSILGAPSAVFDGSSILVFGRSRVQDDNPREGDLVGAFVDPSTHNRVGDWLNLGRPAGDSVNGSPVAVAGTNEVYVQGAARKVYRYTPGIGFPVWEDLGGVDVKLPVQAVKQGDNVHVFALRTVFDEQSCSGGDRTCDDTWPIGFVLAHKYHDEFGAWTPGPQQWVDVPDGGYIRGMPSVASCSADSVEVVVKGFWGDAFYQVWREGQGWLSAWVPLGGNVIGTPTITCHLDMAVVAANSTNGNVYLNLGMGEPGPNRFQPWFGWLSSGYPLFGAKGTPMVYSDGENIEILARDFFDDIYRRPPSSNTFQKISSAKVTW